MRKTRLVILPTKCLNQMGFLLLFLSCPVIGDWGRIRPESATSHKAIQIEREGTCGLQRDPPGGLLDVLNENGPKQCRLGEDNDLIKPTPQIMTRRTDERRVDLRRLNQRRDVRRSLEYRRLSLERNERVRSFSLDRAESERRNIRREADSLSRRLSLTRRTSERRDERRVSRLREDENRRTLRTVDTERRDARRENERRDANRETERRDSRRQNDVTRRLTRDVRERTTERRLSLTRLEQDTRRMERSEDRRLTRNTRSLENLETIDRRDIDNRRLDTLSQKRVASERRFERMDGNRIRIDSKPRHLNGKDESFLEGIAQWTDFKSYQTPKIGDWTTNCVIGAVTYFLTTRQVKTV